MNPRARRLAATATLAVACGCGGVAHQERQDADVPTDAGHDASDGNVDARPDSPADGDMESDSGPIDSDVADADSESCFPPVDPGLECGMPEMRFMEPGDLYPAGEIEGYGFIAVQLDGVDLREIEEGLFFRHAIVTLVDSECEIIHETAGASLSWKDLEFLK